MSFMGRAFGLRGRPSSDAPLQLEKVLADLHVSEEENDDLDAPGAAVVAEALTPPAARPSSPPDHRARLEELLHDADRIAQLLEKEAAEATLAENLKLDEKRTALAKLAEAEREAEAQSRALTQQIENASMHRAQIGAVVRAAQHAVSSAEDSVKELEARLAEAQNVVVQTKAKLAESERRAHDVALQAEANAAEVHEANARISKCREAREAAESEVREAEAIARGITQTAATLKQLRAAGSNGLAEAR